jgi:hypothetical protein
MRRLPFFFALSFLCLAPACVEMKKKMDEVAADIRLGCHVDEPDAKHIAAIAGALVKEDGYSVEMGENRPDTGPNVFKFIAEKLAGPPPRLPANHVYPWTVSGYREYTETRSIPSENWFLRLLDWHDKVTYYHKDVVWVQILPEKGGACVGAYGRAQETSSTASSSPDWRIVPTDGMPVWSGNFRHRLRSMLVAANVHQDAPLAR